MLNCTKEDFLALLDATFSKNNLSSYLTEESREKFYLLTEYMLKENENFNLTAIKDPEKICLLHYADSILSADSFAQEYRVIDVGCGAGFPCIPLAIVRPDLFVTAMDATAKRVRYIERVMALLGLSRMTALEARAEEVAGDITLRECYDIATARAVAPMNILAEFCLPYVKLGGHFIALKGNNAREEYEIAKSGISRLGGGDGVVKETPIFAISGECFSHTTIIIPKISETPREFPRNYGHMKKKPLA